MDFTPFFIVGAQLTVLAVAVITDLRSRRIYNKLTLPAACLGVLANTLHAGWAGTVASGQGWLLPVVLLSVPFAMGWLGGGDVKLVAALGALRGADYVLATCLFTALFGGALAAVALGREGKLLPALRHLFFAWWLPRANDGTDASKHRTPYAPAIALGALTTLVTLPIGWAA